MSRVSQHDVFTRKDVLLVGNFIYSYDHGKIENVLTKVFIFYLSHCYEGTVHTDVMDFSCTEKRNKEKRECSAIPG